MYVNAIFHALVLLLRLHLLVTVLVYWFGTYRKANIATPYSMVNVLGLGSFTSNIWAGQAKDATFGFFIDERPKNSSEKLCK